MGRHLKDDYTDKICGCWHVLKRDMKPFGFKLRSYC